MFIAGVALIKTCRILYVCCRTKLLSCFMRLLSFVNFGVRFVGVMLPGVILNSIVPFTRQMILAFFTSKILSILCFRLSFYFCIFSSSDIFREKIKTLSLSEDRVIENTVTR